MQSKLEKDVQYIKGVGPRRAKLLARLGINTVKDLLFYFPRDYEDRRNIKKIKYIKPGNKVTVQGKVVKIEEQKVRKGLSILRVTFSDDTDVINGVWFNQSYRKKQFKKGNSYIISGQVNKTSWWKYNKKEINNPVFEEIKSDDKQIHTGRVVPIYSLTGGIQQKRLRKIIYNVLSKYVDHVNDILPVEIKEDYKLLDIVASISGLHFPENRKHYIKARKRIAFEELFLLQLKILEYKAEIVNKTGIKHKSGKSIIKKFTESLAFNLTSAQEKVWKEIKDDMENSIPMQRLLQGDVGSGKTVVAALALIKTVNNNNQGVFMAPTEILAEQHYLNLKELLSPLGINVILLVGGLKDKEKQKIKNKIANKQVDLIIGTHTLFQESVEYQKLGLIVIDEQHRFGVNQRHKLFNKGDNPDMLVMTATPIPRSLALTLYGDLDLSIINELPPGRSKIITTWRKKNARPSIYKFISQKLDEGRQAFVVCPLIEPSEDVDYVSAERMKKNLEHNYLQGYNIGILHSKIKQDEKKRVMDEFREGNINVLVSTTVVEVGVDIPNASIMVIEDAVHFGLAQLHQLRGRVGRGEHQSYCILIANPTTEESYKRLKVITETGDGFTIAEEDLKIRGPGEFFGTKQHGLPDLKVANILEDNKLLNFARKEARKLINLDNWSKKYPKMANKLKKMQIKL